MVYRSLLVSKYVLRVPRVPRYNDTENQMDTSILPVNKQICAEAHQIFMEEAKFLYQPHYYKILSINREPTMLLAQHVRVSDVSGDASWIHYFVQFMNRRARLGTPLRSLHMSLVSTARKYFPIDGSSLKKLEEVKVRDEVVFKLRVFRWEVTGWKSETRDITDEPEKWTKKEKELGSILYELKGKMLSP